MSEISFDITMEGDREGYVTFECPFCGSSFGLRADEVKNDEGTLDKIYCPYCGLNSDSDEFLPQEVIESGFWKNGQIDEWASWHNQNDV